MIPWQRIMEKLDEFADREDYDGLEKLLLYWYGEAEMSGDDRGLLLVCNELTGHYRKSGDQEMAFRYADQSVKLLKVLEMEPDNRMPFRQLRSIQYHVLRWQHPQPLPEEP